MLIERIRDDMITARKGADPIQKSLLVTLYAEAFIVGKNKRNGPSTDEECVAVIRKFLTNSEETARLLEARGKYASDQAREQVILQSYLPTQMTEVELTQAVQHIVADLNVSGVKAMGTIMSELKTRHAGTYDGKLASQIVKSVLS